MSDAAELEREAEAARARLSDTADQIRARMSPGQLMDEVLNQFRGGDGSQMLANLRGQVRDNPMALALVGSGLAWLMMGSGAQAQGLAGPSGAPSSPRTGSLRHRPAGELPPGGSYAGGELGLPRGSAGSEPGTGERLGSRDRPSGSAASGSAVGSARSDMAHGASDALASARTRGRGGAARGGRPGAADGPRSPRSLAAMRSAGSATPPPASATRRATPSSTSSSASRW